MNKKPSCINKHACKEYKNLEKLSAFRVKGDFSIHSPTIFVFPILAKI